jgi:hypothetical protein
MSELLTIALYMLICRELGQPAYFTGNEYFWTSLNNDSYAPSLADLMMFASTNAHTANEAFNHANGDIFVRKHMWQDFVGYLGIGSPKPVFNKAAGQVDTLPNEIDMVEWARDKRGFWERVVEKCVGWAEASEWGLGRSLTRQWGRAGVRFRRCIRGGIWGDGGRIALLIRGSRRIGHLRTPGFCRRGGRCWGSDLVWQRGWASISMLQWHMDMLKMVRLAIV